MRDEDRLGMGMIIGFMIGVALTIVVWYKSAKAHPLPETPADWAKGYKRSMEQRKIEMDRGIAAMEVAK